MLVRSKLGNFSTTVICVSEEYLAVGEEQGDIIIYQGGPNNWSRVEHQLQDNIKKAGCCTSMMFLQEKGEQGNIHFKKRLLHLRRIKLSSI